MGTCGQPGYVFRDFCLKQGIKFIIFCLNQGIKLKPKPRMYADDTHLTYADNDICSIETSLNQDLSNINRWLIANKLTLNMTKTEFMLIGSRQKLNSLSAFPVLEINGAQLNRVNFTKSLGVLIDENLTWSNHINAITKKISSGIGSIKRISHCVPPATLHTIYHGLVQSHFDYCSVVWGNCAKTLSDKLQRLQNRAVRVLTNTCYDADANQLLKELGWENLETRRQKLKAEMVYKSLNGLAPNYLSSRFIQRSDVITAYNLRDSDGKLAIPLPRTITKIALAIVVQFSGIVYPQLLGKQLL